MKKHNQKLVLSIFIPLYWFSLYTYGSYLTEYITSLGETMAFAGIVSGLYGLSQMLLRIPAGLLSDSMGRRRPFVMLGCALSTLAALGFFFVKSPAWLVIFRCLTGAAATCWVQISVLYSSCFENSDAIRAIGSAISLNSLGQLLGFLGGTVAANMFDIRATFILAVVGGAVGFALSFFTRENKIEKARGSFWKNLVSDKAALYRLLVVSFFAVLAQIMLFGGPYGFAPKLAKDYFGANKLLMGLLTVMSTLATVICSKVLSGRLQRAIGSAATLAVGFLLCSAYFFSVPFINELWLLYVMQAVYGAGQGTLFPVLMGLSIKDVEESKRASFMGVFQSVYGLGMFIGPSLVGVLGDAFGLIRGFSALGFVGAATAVLTVPAHFMKNKISAPCLHPKHR